MTRRCPGAYGPLDPKGPGNRLTATIASRPMSRGRFLRVVACPGNVSGGRPRAPRERAQPTLDPSQLLWHADAGIAWEYLGVLLRELDAPYSTIQYFVSMSWIAGAATAERLEFPDLAVMPGWHPGLAHHLSGPDLSWDTWIYRGRYDAEYTICGAGSYVLTNVARRPQLKR